MTRVVKVLSGATVAAVALLGVVAYTLYEKNQEQAAVLERLSRQVQPVDEVRQQVIREAEDTLGKSAAAYTSAANRMENRIASLESDVEDMQGMTWSPLGPSLGDLQSQLDQVEGDLAYFRLESGLSRVARRASAGCFKT